MNMKGNSVRLGTGKPGISRGDRHVGMGAAAAGGGGGGGGSEADAGGGLVIELPSGGSKIVPGLVVDASPDADLTTWVKLALMDLEARVPEEAAVAFAPLPFMHQKFLIAAEKNLHKISAWLSRCAPGKRAARLLVRYTHTHIHTHTR